MASCVFLCTAFRKQAQGNHHSKGRYVITHSLNSPELSRFKVLPPNMFLPFRLRTRSRGSYRERLSSKYMGHLRSLLIKTDLKVYRQCMGGRSCACWLKVRILRGTICHVIHVNRMPRSRSYSSSIFLGLLGIP